jgi:phage terminase small subunit
MAALKNAKWERFAWAYVNETNENASEAARIAGSTAKRSDQAGYELLSRPEIQARIKELRDERWKALQMSRDEVLGRLSRAARFDVRKLYDEAGNLKPAREWDDETAGGVAGIDVVEIGGPDSGIPVLTKKVKGTDRIKALELLGRVHGVFEEDNKQQGAASAKLVELLAEAAKQSGGVGGLLKR